MPANSGAAGPLHLHLLQSDVATSTTEPSLQVTGTISSSPMGMPSEHSMRSCFSCASLATSVPISVCKRELNSHSEHCR